MYEVVRWGLVGLEICLIVIAMVLAKINKK